MCEWLSQSIWGYPIIAGIHVLGLAWFGATVLTAPGEFKAWKRIGLVVMLGLSGLMAFGDHLNHGAAGFADALAFTAGYLVAQVANLVIFDSLRRRMLGRAPGIRHTLSILNAQLLGWAAFAGVSYAYATAVTGASPSVLAGIIVLATGSALYVAAFGVVAAIPFTLSNEPPMYSAGPLPSSNPAMV